MSKTITDMKTRKTTKNRNRHKERRELEIQERTGYVRTYRPEPDYPPVLEGLPYVNARLILS